MSENTDALEQAYGFFNGGQLDEVGNYLEDDVRWEGPNTEGVPMSGEHQGKDDVLQALGQIAGDYQSFGVSPDEMIEQGDAVVVLSHIEATTNSGNNINTPGVEIWRMRNARGYRVQTLLDTALVKQALDG